MEEMEWDGEYRAPAGCFRVIATDEFDEPPESYWVGDFEQLPEALEAAEAEGTEEDMTTTLIYDEHGNVVG